MNRKTFLVALPLTVALVGSGVAFGQSGAPRPAPTKVSSSTTPKRDRTAPHVFTTTGKVSLPDGVTGTCPAGTSPAYCPKPTTAELCTGVVNVLFQKRDSTISSRNVNLRSDCTYRSRITFRSLSKARRGSLRIRARFQGNTYLRPRSSSTHTVRAG